jgi:hypothetical protein
LNGRLPLRRRRREEAGGRPSSTCRPQRGALLTFPDARARVPPREAVLDWRLPFRRRRREEAGLGVPSHVVLNETPILRFRTRGPASLQGRPSLIGGCLFVGADVRRREVGGPSHAVVGVAPLRRSRTRGPASLQRRSSLNGRLPLRRRRRQEAGLGVPSHVVLNETPFLRSRTRGPASLQRRSYLNGGLLLRRRRRKQAGWAFLRMCGHWSTRLPPGNTLDWSKHIWQLPDAIARVCLCAGFQSSTARAALS